MLVDCRSVAQNSSHCILGTTGSEWERDMQIRNGSGHTHLFYFCIFFNINFLSTIFFKLHSLNSIKSNATGQVRPAVYCLGIYSTLYYFKHHLFVVHVHWSADTKEKPNSKQSNTPSYNLFPLSPSPITLKLHFSNMIPWRIIFKQYRNPISLLSNSHQLILTQFSLEYWSCHPEPYDKPQWSQLGASAVQGSVQQQRASLRLKNPNKTKPSKFPR